MISKHITFGVYGGLVGGVVFGVMMAMMGMLPMIGSMVGLPSVWAGFVVHMGLSAIIGGGFGFAADLLRLERGIATGAVYGILWWLLGPLTLMPLAMGMGVGVNWNITAMTQALPSLVGHVVFGVVLGMTYHWYEQRARWGSASHQQRPVSP